ncbi:phosphatase 2C-like domain-containing protein [Aspergillus californicus]
MDDPAADSIALHAFGGASAQGSRPSQQDRYLILTPEGLPSGIGDTLALFAVFDGHGSHLVAQHAKKNVPVFIFESSEFLEGNYERAMQVAMEREDKCLFDEFCHGEDRFSDSGTTVSIALINLTRGILVVGNLGDSHILLAEREPDSPQLKSVDRLTESHKPETPAEKQRIEDAGGKIHSQRDVWRIGSLNMSRALGDLEYKGPLNKIATASVKDTETKATDEEREQRRDFLSIQMSSRRIELEKDKQYILALTTDGVTNYIQDDIAMHSLLRHSNSGMDAEEVAQSLVNEATGRPGSDNATCIAVILNGVSTSRN